MKQITSLLRSHLYLFYYLLVITPVTLLADDTEIYGSGTSIGALVRPNINFIIDTSGSMDTNSVTITHDPVPYNPATAYSYSTCDTSAIYWSTDGSVPSCSSNNKFTTTANKCSVLSGAAFTSAGQASGMRAASWTVNGGTVESCTEASEAACAVLEICTGGGYTTKNCSGVSNNNCNTLSDPAKTACKMDCYWQRGKKDYYGVLGNYRKCQDVPKNSNTDLRDCTLVSSGSGESQSWWQSQCLSDCYDYNSFDDKNKYVYSSGVACNETNSIACAATPIGGSCGGGTVTGMTTCTVDPVCTTSNIDVWSTIASGSSNVTAVECEADNGVHGDGVDTGKLYPANENYEGPWRADSSNAISWTGAGAAGAVYTFYTGNYLAYYNNPANAGTTETVTRLTVVQRVFEDLLDQLSGVNIALMRFDNNGSGMSDRDDGAYFIAPMAELTNTNRPTYQALVGDGYDADEEGIYTYLGYTPLSESLYESYLFWSGGTVYWGDGSPGGTSVTTAAGIAGAPATGTRDPANTSKYQSPIEYTCQSNFNVFLTDGDPVGDGGSNTSITSLPNFSTAVGQANCNDSYGNNCLDDLSKYMANSDMNATLEGTQKVLTYTIGFAGGNVNLLTAAATGTKSDGTPGFFYADDYDGLLLAFQQIFQQILSTSTSFVSPSISVNAFNRFSHLEQLYYALFKVDERPQWSGNVKRYKLLNNQVVDVNDAAAVDPDTGFFKETAQSWWSSGVDGGAVNSGGAAENLGANRNVYTYTGASAPNNVLLTQGTHRVTDTNTAITKIMLGNAAMSDAYRSQLLQWSSGIDLKDEDIDGSTTDARTHMGDPLHSVPLLVNYGGTADDMKLMLYVGTNEGYLHAVDPDDGHEVFSFIPPQLLPNLDKIYVNDINEPHPYGLDGPISRWHKDDNHNGLLYTGFDLDSNEKLYIYAAMRRGGRNYYALDVTDESAPKYAWQILGGQGDFSELGQTWSKAIAATIKINGVDKDVLIFGGGYDPQQDNVSVRTADTMGRAIYIVDAETGAKLWQAGPAGSGNVAGADPDLVQADMLYSIPSDLMVIDSNRDGYDDRLYFGDMGGRLWRFDINNENTGAATLARGGIIADLAGTAAADNRRFYYPPAVAYAASKFYLAIGSGYRAHPLNTTIQDAMFVIADPKPIESMYSNSVNLYVDSTGPDGDADLFPDYLQFYGAAAYDFIKLTSGSLTSTSYVSGDLFDATSNILGSATGATLTAAKSLLNSKAGWYMKLNVEADGSWAGEKLLANAVVFDSKLMFSTFQPSQAQLNICAPDVGTAKFYQIDLLTGTPPDDPTTQEDETTIRGKRYVNLQKGGIPPEPVVIIPPGTANPVVMVGPEKIAEMTPPNAVTRTSWQLVRP
ncbi:MAG: hypothetical protein HQL49_03135 [Gammaproteobacteria bacterium]|nr:hypothetical protein [Gammaproteobacteria bacterium]